MPFWPKYFYQESGWLSHHSYLYVNDLILIGSDPKLLSHVKSNPEKKFEMIDLGHLHYFLASKSWNQMKEFLFPSLGMYVTFVTTFTWNIVN